MTTIATIEAIRPVAARITSDMALCGSWLRKTEKEVMICQTLRAAVVRSDAGKEAASIKAISGNWQNVTPYRELVADGYFVEAEADGETLIYPTTKLVEAVVRHLDEKDAGRPA